MGYRKAYPNPKEMGVDFLRKSNYLDTLTPKELQVLQLISEGLNNKTITLRTNVHLVTLNTHIRNIYSKLACDSSTMNPRVQATLVYLGKKAEGED